MKPSNTELELQGRKNMYRAISLLGSNQRHARTDDWASWVAFWALISRGRNTMASHVSKHHDLMTCFKLCVHVHEKTHTQKVHQARGGHLWEQLAEEVPCMAVELTMSLCDSHYIHDVTCLPSEVVMSIWLHVHVPIMQLIVIGVWKHPCPCGILLVSPSKRNAAYENWARIPWGRDWALRSRWATIGPNPCVRWFQPDTLWECIWSCRVYIMCICK